MVAQTNRFFRQSQALAAQPNQVYGTLVPLPSQDDLELHRSAQSLVQGYNSTIEQVNNLKASAQLNPGPVLKVEVKGLPLPLRITNLTRFDPKGESPLWNVLRQNQPFEVIIQRNQPRLLLGVEPKDSKAYETQGDPPTHRYQVIGRFEPAAEPQMVGDGQDAKWETGQEPPSFYSLGTLDKAVAQELEQQLNLEDWLGEELVVQSAILGSNLDQEHAMELLRSAEENALMWVETVGSRETEAALRSLYHAGLDLETGYHTGGPNGYHLALKLFPQQIVPYLEQFSLTEGRAIGVANYSQELGNPQWQGQTAPVRVGVVDDPESPIYGRTVWQVGYDVAHPEGGYQRQWATIGVVNQDDLDPKKLLREANYRLPVGVEAQANLKPLAPSFKMQAEDGRTLTMAAHPDQQQRLMMACAAQISLKLSLEKSADGYQWKVIGYIKDQPLELGQLGREDNKALNKAGPNQRKRLSAPQAYSLTALPVKAVQIELIGHTVQRSESQRWTVPTIESWQQFVAQPQPRLSAPQWTREQVLCPMQLEQPVQTAALNANPRVGGEAIEIKVKANDVEPVRAGAGSAASTVQVGADSRAKTGVRAEPQMLPEPVPVAASGPLGQGAERAYQEALEQIAPFILKCEEQTGCRLTDSQRDQSVAMYLMKQAALANPQIDLGRDPVRVQIINALEASPYSQSLEATQGRQAVCDHINKQLQAAEQYAAKTLNQTVAAKPAKSQKQQAER